MFFKKPLLPSQWLIVGLGNPGGEYRNTRHNVGFDLVERLAHSAGKRFSRSKNRAMYEQIMIGAVPVTLLKPLTYMNLSGGAVKPWLRELHLECDRLLVISDDLHLRIGKLRLREKGSAGGHNGHKSIISSLGSENYPRLRIGIGKSGEDTIDHVLGKFSPTERAAMDVALKLGEETIKVLITEGFDKALHVIDQANSG